MVFIDHSQSNDMGWQSNKKLHCVAAWAFMRPSLRTHSIRVFTVPLCFYVVHFLPCHCIFYFIPFFLSKKFHLSLEFTSYHGIHILSLWFLFLTILITFNILFNGFFQIILLSVSGHKFLVCRFGWLLRLLIFSNGVWSCHLSSLQHSLGFLWVSQKP